MKKIKSYLKILIVSLFLFLPEFLLAAEMNFVPVENDKIGDNTKIVEVRIDPQSKNLNVVEGALNFSGDISKNISIKIETGGSLLSVWPKPPVYVSDKKSIQFVGGVPGGFDKEGLLFRLIISSDLAGVLKIDWHDATVYLNDGKGTRDSVFSKSITLKLEKQNTDIVKESLDKNPPYFDVIEIGQDKNSYEGKYFVSFHAVDNDSGIAKYEVIEGDKKTETTNGVYVFLDQTMKTPTKIIAYDFANNNITTDVPLRFNLARYIIILTSVVFLVILIYVYKKFFKK